MEMYHQTEDGKTIQYELRTDPPEAMYWTTYRLLKSHVHILTKLSKTDETKYRTEIYDDIIEREPNTRGKSKPKNEVQKVSKTAIRIDAKARSQQRKTRR